MITARRRRFPAPAGLAAAAGVTCASAEIGFTGWATAENRERCVEILANMHKHLLGV